MRHQTSNSTEMQNNPISETYQSMRHPAAQAQGDGGETHCHQCHCHLQPFGMQKAKVRSFWENSWYFQVYKC